MIGPKKLTAIRQELHNALGEAGDDPIRWLEQRMTSPVHHGVGPSRESEILLSLRRFIEATAKEKRRKQRASTAK